MKNILLYIVTLIAILSLTACPNPTDEPNWVINISSISGVTVPTYDEIPVSSITETSQFTGTVIWSPVAGSFAMNTVYTATISLTAKSGYTLNGVEADFFTLAGASTVSNDANSGIVTAVFPATENKFTISASTVAEAITAVNAFDSDTYDSISITLADLSVDVSESDALSTVAYQALADSLDDLKTALDGSGVSFTVNDFAVNLTDSTNTAELTDEAIAAFKSDAAVIKAQIEAALPTAAVQSAEDIDYNGVLPALEIIATSVSSAKSAVEAFDNTVNSSLDITLTIDVDISDSDGSLSILEYNTYLTSTFQNLKAAIDNTGADFVYDITINLNDVENTSGLTQTDVEDFIDYASTVRTGILELFPNASITDENTLAYNTVYADHSGSTISASELQAYIDAGETELINIGALSGTWTADQINSLAIVCSEVFDISSCDVDFGTTIGQTDLETFFSNYSTEGVLTLAAGTTFSGDLYVSPSTVVSNQYSTMNMNGKVSFANCTVSDINIKLNNDEVVTEDCFTSYYGTAIELKDMIDDICSNGTEPSVITLDMPWVEINLTDFVDNDGYYEGVQIHQINKGTTEIYMYLDGGNGSKIDASVLNDYYTYYTTDTSSIYCPSSFKNVMITGSDLAIGTLGETYPEYINVVFDCTFDTTGTNATNFSKASFLGEYTVFKQGISDLSFSDIFTIYGHILVIEGDVNGNDFSNAQLIYSVLDVSKANIVSQINYEGTRRAPFVNVGDAYATAAEVFTEASLDNVTITTDTTYGQTDVSYDTRAQLAAHLLSIYGSDVLALLQQVESVGGFPVIGGLSEEEFNALVALNSEKSRDAC